MVVVDDSFRLEKMVPFQGSQPSVFRGVFFSSFWRPDETLDLKDLIRPYLDVPGTEVLGSMVNGSMGYNILINGVYWGYNL